LVLIKVQGYLQRNDAKNNNSTSL